MTLFISLCFFFFFPFSCFFLFVLIFWIVVFFVVAFFNLCKHDGDEERLARLPDTSGVLGCERHTHTGIDDWAECFLSLPRPPLSVGPKIRL